MRATKRLLRQMFTRAGFQEKKAVQGIVTGRVLQVMRHLPLERPYKGKLEVLSYLGREATITYRLQAYPCKLPDYHQCISVEVFLEGKEASIAIILVNAATKGHIKIIWS